MKGFFMLRYLSAATILVGSLLLQSTCSFAQPQTPDVPELLQLLPADTNAVAIVRVADNELLRRASQVPDWVTLVVRGTHHQPGRPSDSIFSLAPRPTGLSVTRIAETLGRPTEQIGNRVSVHAPRGYLTEISPRVLGLQSPGQRQAFGRWVRWAQGRQRETASSYIQSLGKLSEASVVLGLDLADMIEPERLIERIRLLKSAPADEKAQQALLEQFMQVHGVSLQIDLKGQEPHPVRLTIDFTAAPAPAEIVHELVIQIVDDLGLHLDELNQGTLSAKPTAVEISMSFSDAAVEQVLALFIAPLPEEPVDSTVAQTPVTSTKAEQRDTPDEINRQYFLAIDRLVLTLQRQSNRSSNHMQVATWHRQFASRIRNLPVTGVDRELIAYANQIADGLEALAGNLRNEARDLMVAEQSIQTSFQPNGWFGMSGVMTIDGYHPAPWEIQTNLGEVRSRQAQMATQGSFDRADAWTALITLRDQTQRTMRSKYTGDWGPQGVAP